MVYGQGAGREDSRQDRHLQSIAEQREYSGESERKCILKHSLVSASILVQKGSPLSMFLGGIF